MKIKRKKMKITCYSPLLTFWYILLQTFFFVCACMHLHTLLPASIFLMGTIINEQFYSCNKVYNCKVQKA